MKSIITLLVILLLSLFPTKVFAIGEATQCPGTSVSFPGVIKKLVPLGKAYGRPGDCVIPTKIVMHTTESSADADGIWQYFASGSEGRGVNTHYIIGNDGKTIQSVEMLQKTVEVAYGVAGYNSQAISIELTYNGVYHDKISAPPAQYNAALSLVHALMQQYNIPLGNLGYTFSTASDTFDATVGNGIYGHYQLNPGSRTDPGNGFLRDFLVDVAKNVGNTPQGSAPNGSNTNGQSPCVVTKVGNPSVSPVLPATCTTGTTTGDGSPRGQKPPNYPSDLAGAIKDNFGITIEGFDNNSDFMKWMWEKLWDIKGTNFSSLIKGAIVKRTDADVSQQVGCPGEKNINGGDESVDLVAYPYGEAFFKYIFTHELGHVIRNCNTRDKIRWNDTIAAAQSEGAVSYYGAHASECFAKGDNDAENYADMVAYYLNPDAGLSTAKCGGAAPASPPNPFFGTSVLKPFQFAIAKSVLN